MEQTQSETMFERFCDDNALQLERVPEEADAKTPDYLLRVGEIEVVVEVKEFQPNAEERESERLLEEKGFGGVITQKPGARVRKKINDSSAQIRSRTKGVRPGLLVLFDRGRGWDHLDPYHIKTAMFGLEQVHVSVPKDPSESPYATGMSHGPGQKMTPNDNTSISAVAPLWMTDSETVHLAVYHNDFATMRIAPELLAPYPIVQYLPTKAGAGRTRDWVKYES